jgi:hypothetical protein
MSCRIVLAVRLVRNPSFTFLFFATPGISPMCIPQQPLHYLLAGTPISGTDEACVEACTTELRIIGVVMTSEHPFPLVATTPKDEVVTTVLLIRLLLSCRDLHSNVSCFQDPGLISTVIQPVEERRNETSSQHHGQSLHPGVSK